ncbi:hypothetical protein IWW38_005549, partial [Coemansia aciculifera]
QAVQHVEALVAAMRIRAHVTSTPSPSSPSWWASLETRLEACRKQVAIGYHHDAITGTCSKEAADDYKQRLRHAARDALAIGRAAITGADSPPFSFSGAYNTAAQFGMREDPDSDREYVIMDDSVAVTNAGALAPQDAVVRVLLPSLNSEIVDAETGAAVDADALDSSRPVVEFLARAVPALGLRTYAVRSKEGSGIARVKETTADRAVLAKGGSQYELRVVGGRVRIAAGGGSAVVWHSLRQYFANPLIQASGAYIMHSFMLMYMFVFAIFGVALILGLAAAVFVYRHQPKKEAPYFIPPLAGTVCGVAFTYYVAQVADVAMLTEWTVGRGLVVLRLVLPPFASAYAVAALLRWTPRRCVLCVYGLAAGVIWALFWVPTWQSRPIHPASALFDIRHGTVCDTATITAGTARITYRLCADHPTLLQVSTAVAAGHNREV